MCAEQPEFGNHRIRAVAERDQFVVLVRKGGARFAVVAAHFIVAVVHCHGGDDFVVRMRKRGQHIVPVLQHLVTEMVQHQLFSRCKNIAWRPLSQKFFGSFFQKRTAVLDFLFAQ
jgi:hypothetical protein